MAKRSAVDKNDLRVDAYPTREFFVSMIVKDVGLVAAIIDLVDNSLDGAKRLRRGRSYDGLQADLKIDEQYFEIVDNCGGIDLKTARYYAFCFGRPGGAKLTRGSVGRFGIGMKRALCKMGREFEVESRTASSEFRVHVDIDEWLKQEGEWRFEFAEPPKEGVHVPKSRQGTRITVRQLHSTVADEFRLESFRDSLAEEIESKHSESLAKGLRISVNGRSLKSHPLKLRSSQQLRPAVCVLSRSALHRDDVRIRMLVGLGTSDPNKAGWYVFCNDRVVIEADQSNVTGWGVSGATPHFHNQYAEFRGYVFMDSDDPLGLPWNTTKTNVDSNSPIFKSVQSEMVQMLQPVTRFLNRLKAEKDRRRREGKGPGPIEKAVSGATLKSLSLFRKQQRFKFPPEPSQAAKPDVAQIRYTVPPDDLQKVKESLGAKSNSEAGRRTFDYYLEMECEA